MTLRVPALMEEVMGSQRGCHTTRKKKEDETVREKVANALIRARAEGRDFWIGRLMCTRHIHILDTEVLFQHRHNSNCSS